jgi:anthranilate/para-aminobenzoate synthase component I
MQIIDELETSGLGPRGPYCGAIGFFSDCGALTLNVAIRTMTIEGGAQAGRCDRLHDATAAYRAGAGIVADSIPAREWQETLDKMVVLRGLTALKTPLSAERRDAPPQPVRWSAATSTD